MMFIIILHHVQYLFIIYLVVLLLEVSPSPKYVPPVKYQSYHSRAIQRTHFEPLGLNWGWSAFSSNCYYGGHHNKDHGEQI